MSNIQFNTRIAAKHDITANWNTALNFIPLKGEIIVYDDYQQIDGRNIPGIKIGDGLAYVVDLPFVVDAVQNQIGSHINNNEIHVVGNDRFNWNNKVSADVEAENLILST